MTRGQVTGSRCSSGAIRAAGFSLIELMVAVGLALFLGLVVVGMMVATGSASRSQTGAARLQQGARHALHEIARDVRRAATSFCLNYSALDGTTTAGAVANVDQRRPLLALFDATAAPYRLGSFGIAPTAPYFVDPAELMIGSECSVVDDACTPDPSVLPSLAAAGERLPAVAHPPVAGARSRGTDVLSMRYLHGSGIPLASMRYATADEMPATLYTLPGHPTDAIEHILATDCAMAFLAGTTASAGALVLNAANFDGGEQAPHLNIASARVFDLDRDLRTVSYFVAFRSDPGSGDGRLVSTLMRRIDGVDELVAEGIERLDFLYHVELADGRTQVLSAADVDTSSNCRGLTIPSGAAVAPARCGWRSLKGVEISLLANSVADAGGETDAAFRYVWRSDGTLNVEGTLEAPTVLPSGLALGRTLRREFRTYVAMRGMNP